MIEVNLISVEVAKEIGNNLAGMPSEDRVLVFHSNDVEKKSGHIIIPGQASDGIAKKGVIVKVGPTTDAYGDLLKKMLVPGTVIVYGNYAGKEIEPKFKKDCEIPSAVGKFIVLSINEIIYLEDNI